jgi:carbonic anhydrase
MAAHLVHKNKAGKLAVVTVLMQAASENPFIRTLWTHLPLDTGVDVSIPTVSVDLNQFLPRSKGYFVYSGSLTTPPCTEGVLWVVLRSPVQVSRQQIGVFTKLYKNNARPIQNANGRLIKESL